MSTYASTRRTRLILGASAAALGLGLALAVPVSASAHVGVSPEAITADESTVLTFSFTHGCDGSPTAALRITMPDGLTSVSPSASAEWDVTSERGADGLLTAVTYSAVTPVPNDLRGAVTLAVRAGEDITGPLMFPVEQNCVDGSAAWTEVAAEGEDPHDLDSPAPVISMLATTADTSDHGGHAAPSADQTESSAAPAESSPFATLLGTGGLLAGVAAMIVSVIALRRAG